MEPLLKLFEPHNDPRHAGYLPPLLTKRVLLIALVAIVLAGLFGMFPPQNSHGAERISFSISEAEPQVVQASAHSGVNFSIHAREESATTKAAPRISFSVYDAQPLVADAKPDCSPSRTLNRVLVIHASKTVTLVKVCDQNGCRFVEQVSPQPPPSSHKLIDELTKLTEKKSWKAGATECDHFWIVDIDEPKNAKLIKELDVKRSELPLLVKESNVEMRKKASGLKANDLADAWNKWFREPQPEATTSVEQCVPTVGGFMSGPRWDYTGNGTLRQHLTDPRGLHHLPAAVVNQWTDSQVQTWHNWHHEVLSGSRSVQRKPNASPARASSRLQMPAGESSSRVNLASRRSVIPSIESRTLEISRATIHVPPPQMVADASRHSDKRAKKKRSTIFANGSLTNGSA